MISAAAVMGGGQDGGERGVVEEADRNRADQEDRIRGRREGDEPFSFGAVDQLLLPELGGQPRADRIAGSIAHRDDEAADAGDAEQRPHERIQEFAEEMDDAEAKQQLGDDEEGEQRREEHFPPDGQPPQGSSSAWAGKRSQQQDEHGRRPCGNDGRTKQETDDMQGESLLWAIENHTIIAICPGADNHHLSSGILSRKGTKMRFTVK